MPLSTGQVLNNRYRVVRLLGQGGFGAVYRAWDINFERPLALKENLDTSPEAQRQFKREAQILFDLSHPNLPRVIDHFIIPGQGQYLAMEFVEGQDLQQMLDVAVCPLPVDQVLSWIKQVCGALEYLHNQSPPVIHRDIKPGNIKITPDGKVMLVDFGIAKIFEAGLSTTRGARAVTPGYSPLEQYGSTGKTDARTDLYALGATLYHLLTGQMPLDAPERNLGEPITPPRELNPEISEALEAVMYKALMPLPAARYQSAGQFCHALEEVEAQKKGSRAQVVKAQRAPSAALEQTYPPTIKTLPDQTAQANKPFPWLWIGTISLVVVLLVLGWGIFSAWNEAVAPEKTAAAILTLFTPTDTLRPSARYTATKRSTTTLTPTITRTPTMTAIPFMDEQGVPMAMVAAGEFQMGSAKGANNEKPPHIVYLDAFYIDIFEVSNTRYADCVSAGKCTLPGALGHADWNGNYGDGNYDNHPVVYVSWYQAQTYCAWRGAQLPTEAQWEKAARGRLENAIYPWGNEDATCELANFALCQSERSPAGSFRPNGYGLFDMAGNVWEWVRDLFGADYYASSPSTEPEGPQSGDNRVARGGAFGSISWILRVTHRNNFTPDSRNSILGFRCMRKP